MLATAAPSGTNGCMSAPVFAKRLGQWMHVAACWSAEAIRIFIDGREFAHFDTVAPVAATRPASRLRIGAMAEEGMADDFLEGDIAQPFVGRFVLDEAGAARLFADGGKSAPGGLGLGEILGYWPLDEENGSDIHDASGNNRHGTLVNHGTWMVGGPLFDAANRKPLEYEPRDDPQRGHGLRLCSDDLMDAGWPVSAQFAIPQDADSGLYAIRIRLAGQAPADTCVTPFVVTRRRPRKEKSVALLCATNTWHAYGRRPTNELAAYGLTSTFYSIHFNSRPFFHLGMRLQIPYAHPYGFEASRSTRTRSTHLVRTERFLEACLSREGATHTN
jgi:N,N-dimethylformamidase